MEGGGRVKRRAMEVKEVKTVLTIRSIASGGQKAPPECSLNQERLDTYLPPKKNIPHTKTDMKRK